MADSGTLKSTMRSRGASHMLTGIHASDPLVLAERVREGLPFRTFELFADRSGFGLLRVATLIDLPARTLARRRSAGRLSANESDRLMRLARVFGLAIDLFEGDVEKARQWFERPQRGLADIAPAAASRTDVGAREVEQLIGRLEHGVVS